MTRPPPASASMLMAAIAKVVGGRAATWHTAVPSLIWLVTAGDVGERGERVDPVRLRRPDRVVAERLGLADGVHRQLELRRAVDLEPKAELQR